MRRILITVVVLLMLGAPDAEAKRKPQRMTFDFAVLVARDYWAKQHVAVPCKPTRRLLSSAESAALDATFGYGVDMVAFRSSCEVGISVVAETYRVDREVDLQWLYCTDVVHEIGHIAGLKHEYGGAMDVARTVIPWGCAHPARFRRLVASARDGFGRR